MKDLVIYNQEIINKVNKINKLNVYATPLLIKPDQKEKNPKTMYIGQETNTWMEGTGITSRQAEDEYEWFLKKGATKRLFWRFIMDILQITDDCLYDNVIWANSIISGLNEKSGTPPMNDTLKDISVDYLVNIYNAFNPDNIIIAAGPKSPYCNIITEFLNQIGIDMKCPDPKKMCVIDDSNRVFWTYHPKALNFSKNIEPVKQKIKQNINIRNHD